MQGRRSLRRQQAVIGRRKLCHRVTQNELPWLHDGERVDLDQRLGSGEG